jgi:hypothetical protein
MSRVRSGWLVLFLMGLASVSHGAGVFRFPTANTALLESGGEERFFVGTAGKPWTSGQFGCVRSEGRQLHEGLDIRAISRDGRGEPTDPVLAAADGTVAYINLKPSLSNYGNYIVLRHRIDRVEIHTLYAHLASAGAGLKVGQEIRAGQRIGTMGRTSNTRQRITPDRAHLHFEICFQVGERFAAWQAKNQPGIRNDHDEFNGRNLVGVDPAPLLRAAPVQSPGFSLARHLASQPETLRIWVRNPHFSWARRFPGLIRRNPALGKEAIAGWEIAMASNGAPIWMAPRSAKEMPGNDRFRLLSVNEAEWKEHPCARLVIRRGQAWTALPALHDLVAIAEY